MTTETILVYVGLDAVGDGLIKLPFVRALRAAFPQSHISWMAGKGHTVFADTLAPLTAGLIDEVIDNAGIGSKPSELVGRRPLAGRTFDLIIDTQRRVMTTLILRRIRHRRLVSATAGFLFSDHRPPERKRPASLSGQMLWLLDAIATRPTGAMAPLPAHPESDAVAARLLPDGPAYVGFAPGAGGKHKCWPLDRYCQLARMAAEREMVPVFLMGPAESEWASAIRAEVPSALLPLQSVSPATPMLTIALAARMRAAVANDSGTGHMLACADIPLISLFGPTPAEKFAPAARRLTVIRAQDFGGSDMPAIPLTAVARALDKCLL